MHPIDPDSYDLSSLQALLHAVFTQSATVEGAHTLLMAEAPPEHRSRILATFPVAKALLRHWYLLCFLAEQKPTLDASLADVLLKVTTDFRPDLDACLKDPASWPVRWTRRLAQAQLDPPCFYSLSPFLWDRLQASHGNELKTILAALNQHQPPTLRVNTLKSTPTAVMQSLQSNGFSVQKLGPETLSVRGETHLHHTEAFRNGWFEIQDRHSQQVAPFCQVKPGQRVLDGCAGAGGKSLHLAALMQNRGQIIAMDIVAQKLERLQERARRAGVHCLQSRLKTSTKTLKRLRDSFDLVLIDAPCSGTGTLGRHPEIKFTLTQQRLDQLQNEQAELLRRHAWVVKPGGTLVYATCSLLNEENTEQISSFLNSFPDFHLQQAQTLLPDSQGGQGFFMARLQRASQH